jgi:hypothetical protein
MNMRLRLVRNIIALLFLLGGVMRVSAVFSCPPINPNRGHMMSQKTVPQQETELVQTFKQACIAMASKTMDAQSVVKQFGTPIFDENMEGGIEWRKGKYNLVPHQSFFQSIRVIEKKYEKADATLTPAKIDEIYPGSVTSMIFSLADNVPLTGRSLKQVFGEHTEASISPYPFPDVISFYSHLPEIAPFQCTLNFYYHTKRQNIAAARFVEASISVTK